MRTLTLVLLVLTIAVAPADAKKKKHPRHRRATAHARVIKHAANGHRDDAASDPAKSPAAEHQRAESELADVRTSRDVPIASLTRQEADDEVPGSKHHP